MFSVASSPHQHNRRTTSSVMQLVILLTLPGLATQIFFFGWGNLIHLLIASIVAVATEALFLEVRKRPFEPAIKDCSALLTALLLAVSIPPLAPWWISAIGAFFAIAIVKQLYGGLGFNIFNPAMAAYVMLLVSFPVHMTSWMPPYMLAEHSHNFFDALSVITTGFSQDGYSLLQLRNGIDGFTMATPLDTIKTDLSQSLTLQESMTKLLFDGASGVGWFWVNLAYLISGLVLIKLRVISWHIPAGMIGSLGFFALVFYLVSPDQYATPWLHWFSGATMLGAFFILTDPVSACTTNKGRIIFGATVGMWVYLIRVFGGYPDAIGFAVVIMNMAVPLIDYYTRPRVYGHSKNKPSRTSQDKS